MLNKSIFVILMITLMMIGIPCNIVAIISMFSVYFWSESKKEIIGTPPQNPTN